MEQTQVKGVVILPGRCPRWWTLRKRYQDQPEELRKALRAHLEACPICAAWLETVSNSGGDAPCPDGL